MIAGYLLTITDMVKRPKKFVIVDDSSLAVARAKSREQLILLLFPISFLEAAILLVSDGDRGVPIFPAHDKRDPWGRGCFYFLLLAPKNY